MFNFPEKNPEGLEFDIKSISEEKYNFYSHGITFLWAIISSLFLVFILIQKNNPIYWVPVLIYCGTLIFAYYASTNYHSKYNLIARRKARTIDHISIYFLIAGSYTPFLMIYLHNQKATYVLIILWALVLIGSIFKYFFTHKFKVVSTLAYLIMGWMAVFIYSDLVISVPEQSLLWIKIGGAFYTLGTIFYLWKNLYQNHFIWHLFVSAGSISHFISIYYCII